MTEKNNIIKAINKNVRSGARKANLILKFIKGKRLIESRNLKRQK